MSGDQQVFLNAMNQGHSAAWDQDWQKASAYYKSAIAEFPDNINALTSLALALFEQQKYQDSLQYYLRAASLTSLDPVPMQKVAEIQERLGNQDGAIQAHLDVAEIFVRNRDIDKAISSWLHVVSLNPENLTAHMRLAVVYERLGQTSTAMIEYIAIASILQSQGNITKAIQTMKHAQEVVPNSKEASLSLSILQSGKLLPRPSRPPGVSGALASSQIRQVIGSQSEEADRPRVDPIQDAKQKATTILAELLFEQEENQGNQARKGLTTIISGTAEVDQEQYDQASLILHLSQSIDLQTHGQDKEAALELERAINAGLESSAANFVLGFMQTKNDQMDAAVANLKKAVHHEFFSLGAHLLLALTLYKMDRIAEASLEYLEALRIADSESVPADQAEVLKQLYEPLIEAYSHQTDTRLQKRICENISKMLIRPDWKNQTQLARQQLPPQPESASPIPLAEMLTEATSGQLVESLSKINQLARANKMLTAMEEAYYALKFAPTYLPLHICIGDLLAQENRVAESVLKYSIVAKSYSVRGETSRAIGLLQRVCELNPVNLEARNNLIDLLIGNSNYGAAVQEYIKLAESYYNLADLNMALKTYTDTYKFAQQNKLDRDTRVKLLHRIADINTQSLDWRNAIHIYEQIRTLDPDDIEARDLLFDLNLRLSQDKQAMADLDNYLNHLISSHRATEALEYLNAKIAENPSQPALYRRLADIYRLIGRKDEAVTQMETAKDMYLQSGNRTAAIDMLMAILAVNPPNVRYYQHMLVELQEQDKKSST